jgi:hypothetical protein
MSPHHRRLSTFGVAAVIACAVAQPAVAGPADLRSPDVRDLAPNSQPATPAVDLRSPDSRDAHRVAPPALATAVVDRRSPDAIDLASGRVPERVPVVSIASPEGGFDWGDAGIGAGGAVAVLLFGLGAAMMTAHRRHRVKPGRIVAH